MEDQLMSPVLELEEIVFASDAVVGQFRNGDPPAIVGKYYVYRDGYFVNDETARRRRFHLRKDAVWDLVCGEEGQFDSDAEALRTLNRAGRSAVARTSS
ncbi:MAG: hypothetical protein AAB927_00680 [Patescibacteria group bacterium]